MMYLQVEPLFALCLCGVLLPDPPEVIALP
jgi:hypothetical protein